MKRIIVYYSNGGTTDLVAKTLAKNLNADLAQKPTLSLPK